MSSYQHKIISCYNILLEKYGRKTELKVYNENSLVI